MIARLHTDFRLRLDAVVYDERQRITVTEGRNCPVRANPGTADRSRLPSPFQHHRQAGSSNPRCEDDATLAGRRTCSQHRAAARLPWPNNPPKSDMPRRHARTSYGTTSYWMFSAVKYRWSAGAMDIMASRAACKLRTRAGSDAGLTECAAEWS